MTTMVFGVHPLMLLVVLGLFAGLALLVAASGTGSLAVFLASIAVTGVGYSLLFAAGVGIAAELAPPVHRATVSTVYFFGYALHAAASIGLGQLTTAEGLRAALAAGVAPFVRARRAVRTIQEGNPA